MEHLKELQKQELMLCAPSIFATFPNEEKVSDRYSFIPTWDIINYLRNDKWYPVYARETRKNKLQVNGFSTQKHLVWFQRADSIINGRAMMLIMTNSHDGSASYVFKSGVFEAICGNGLYTGQLFGNIHVKHIHVNYDSVLNASQNVAKRIPLVMESIQDMLSILLDTQEITMFCDISGALNWGSVRKMPFISTDLTQYRTGRDTTLNLYNVFNRVQENIMKGGLKGYSASGKPIITRAIKSIDREVKVNEGLWNLAELCKKIKMRNGEDDLLKKRKMVEATILEEVEE